jgi:twinkle protein
MDNDDAGKMNIDKFASKLGVSRTFIVLNNEREFKDANDFLQKKPEMIQQLITKAKTLPDQNVVTFNSLRENIKERLINSKKY